MANAIGRPTKYIPETIYPIIDQYIESCSKEQTELPSIEGLALKLDVNTDTLFEELSVCQDLNIEMVIVSRLPGSKYRSSARIIKYILDNFNKRDMDYLIDKDETK